MHELAEAPVHGLDAQVGPLVVGQFVEWRARVLGEVGHLLGVGRGQDGVRVYVGRPVQVGLAVPLRGLGLLVQLVEAGPLTLSVAPGEDGIGVVFHGVDERGHVVVEDGEVADPVRVVGVGTEVELAVDGLLAGHRLGGGHGGSPSSGGRFRRPSVVVRRWSVGGRVGEDGFHGIADG